MAYTTKYYLDHISNKGIPYYVQIQKDGFAGTPQRLKFSKDGLVIDYNLRAWEESIMTLIVQMKILNDASDWYAYEDLFTLEDREFKLVIDASYDGENKRIFDGWVNSSPVNQKYLNNSEINISGSNFVSRMDELTPPILNTADASDGDAVSMINLINDSLKLTGKEDDIYVNNRLEPSLGTISDSTTMFNRCALNPQLFWDDNENKQSGTEIMDSILNPFSCYLYWWDGSWYVERYRDLFQGDTSKGYVKYDADSSYGYDDSGTYVPTTDASYSLPILNCDGSIVFRNSSQTINMIPGLEFIKIGLEEAPVINLVSNDFTEIEGTTDTPQIMEPPYKKWIATQYEEGDGTGYLFPGYKTSTTMGIGDASAGYSFYDTRILKYPATSTALDSYRTGPGKSFRGIQNAMIRYDRPKIISSGNKLFISYGLSTRFKVTVESSETKINIKWKYLPIHVDDSTARDDPRSWDYKLNYTLRVVDGTSFKFLMKQDDDGTGEPYWLYDYETLYTNYLQYERINGADLNDSGYGEVNIEVPIGDVSGWISDGDADIVLAIWGEQAKKSTDESFSPVGAGTYPLTAAYGDVEITADRGVEDNDNDIIAQINSNVLNSESVAFKVFDCSTLFLQNGPLTGNDGFRNYAYRTSLWNEDGSISSRSIVDWYIHDRFQLYNRNRREIKGSINYPGYLKPMSSWWDESDPSTRKYILSAYSYHVDEDYYNCTWMEYDNNTEINLGSKARERPKTLVDPKSGREGRRSTTGARPRRRGTRTTYTAPRPTSRLMGR